MLDLLLSQGILTEEQIKKILTLPIKDRTHPLLQVQQYREGNGFTYYNTEFSIKQILETNIDWLKSQSHRLCDLDHTSASSILGEIRAYGYLTGAGFDIQPVQESNKPTPDFHITHTDGSKIEVEVNSKQFTDDESKALEEFNKLKMITKGNEKTFFLTHAITPFGKPSEQENVAENAISKIAKIKQDERQLSGEIPSILWLDFQDEIWQLVLTIDNVAPLRTWNDDLYAGELWHGFYGKKGLPIFERHSLENRSLESSIVMRHEGRYRSSKKVDACIISFKKDLIILENPFSLNPVPGWFFEKIMLLRHFNIASSWMQWPENKLKNRIENEILRIEALYQIGLYSW